MGQNGLVGVDYEGYAATIQEYARGLLLHEIPRCPSFPGKQELFPKVLKTFSQTFSSLLNFELILSKWRNRAFRVLGMETVHALLT